METRRFLQRVLPVKGTQYYGAAGDANSFRQSAPLTNIDALVTYIDQQDGNDKNVYFATGTYSGERKKNSAEHKRCLYVDIDCGVSKDYQTKGAAIGAFKTFLSTTGFLPPSITVDSGNGIHAYWVFNEDIAPDKWQVMADALKELCLDNDLRIDPTVTADSARILRVPNTRNWKDPTKPKGVKVLGSQKADIPLADMQAALMLFSGSSAVDMLAGTVKDIHLGKPLLTKVERKYYAGTAISNCEVLKESVRTSGADQSQELWALQLQVLSFAEDGADYIHEISEGHASYSERETIAKFNEKQTARKESSVLGPAKCTLFEQHMPEACAKCKFKGKQYSPVHIIPEEDGFADGWRANENGISHKIGVEDEDGSVSWQWEKVSSLHVLGMDVEMRVESNGDAEKICAITWKHNSGDIMRTAVPMKALGTRSDHYNNFIALGLEHVKSNNAKLIRDFFMSYLSKMNSSRARPTRAITAMGWAGDNFHLPEVRITPKGQEPYSLGSASLALAYKPVGDRDVWISLAKHVNGEGLPTADIGILSGFAAPLVVFTEVDAAVLSLNSPKSGSGKTTSMRMGQSIWGNLKTGMGSTRDTTTSMSSRLATLGSLPGYLDDLRFDKDPKGQVDMVYGFTAGRDRGRATTDGSLKETAEWRTMITISSNEGVADRMSHYNNTDATSYRLFEVDVPTLPEGTKPINDALLRENYGIVGVEYAEYLVNNKKAIATAYDKVRADLASKIGYAEGPERFWLATMSTLLLSGYLANKLGFTCVDLSALKNFLIASYKAQQRRTSQITTGSMTFESCIERFLRDNRDGLVIVDEIASRGVPWGMANADNIRGKVLGSINKDSTKLRVCKSELLDWTRRVGISNTMVLDGLEAREISPRKCNYSGGMAGTSDRSLCYDIPL